MKKLTTLLIVAMTMIFTSCGFIRPYDKPEYVSIGTNETAFLIDQFADDNSSGQVKVNGTSDYRTVNSKLVRINHKWVKTGRMRGTGKYLATEIVIAVSNSPVTGTWADDIKVETKGSQGFTVPMKWGIRIKPENSERFLRNFPANVQVMDESGKTKLSKKMTSVKSVAEDQFKTQVAAELSKEFHKYEYKDVLPNRDIIVDAAIERITEWANELGITIDNLAVFEGLIPDDTTLQDSMDEQAKLAAQVETEKKRFDAEKQKKQNEIELQRMETERVKVERQKKEEEAKATVSVQNILAQTSNFELDRKKKEQEIANLKLRGEAEAEAIKLRAKALEEVKFPTVITSNDLKVLGIDSLIQDITRVQ